MNIQEALKTLEFSNEWIELGLVTPEILQALIREYEGGNDTHSEHYRWRAFQGFLDNKKELEDSTARALYRLGENDPDVVMGGSIMATIIQRPDCPRDLVEEATHSDKRFLVKIASDQLAKRQDK